jgi:arsenite methyltransferase
MVDATLRDQVRKEYGRSALRVLRGESGGCGCDPCGDGLYSSAQTAPLPREAVLASLGCGNPTAVAELHEGETVLDLGSGGGIDVLLSAKRVGPTGKAYGVDMTEEMIALARENQRKAGIANAEFLHGEIEHLPLLDGSVDVIISNCVINLSTDKARVLREAFRVLKPGGRLGVADVVIDGDVAPAARQRSELWVACVAGALAEREYRELLAAAGFVDVGIESTGTHEVGCATAAGDDVRSERDRSAGITILSALIRARKPR